MKSLGMLLLVVITIMLLGFCSSGCATHQIILRDREQIFPHPTDPQMVCIDKGYLIYIFEKCK